MKVAEILTALDTQEETLSRRAVEEAMARPAEVTEPLLELVREVARDPARILDPAYNSMGHILALYLLAQFREARAYPLVVEVLSLPEVEMDALFGDVLVDDMGRILASVSGGDTTGIRALVEHPEVDPRVRRSALDALYCLVYCDILERGAVVGYLAELFRAKLERRPSEVWTRLVRTASSLGPEELYDEIHRAHRDGLLVGRQVEFLIREVEENRALGREMEAPQIADTGAHFLIGNTLEEIGGWAPLSA